MISHIDCLAEAGFTCASLLIIQHSVTDACTKMNNYKNAFGQMETQLTLSFLGTHFNITKTIYTSFTRVYAICAICNTDYVKDST